MKELTKEQRDSIEDFKKYIEERWQNDGFLCLNFTNNFDLSRITVLTCASAYFSNQEIPFSVLCDELLKFCLEKRKEYCRKKGIDIN